MKILLSFLLSLLLLFSCRKNNADKPAEQVETWKQFTTAGSGIPDNQVNAIAIGKDDRKWVGTSHGLALYHLNQWQSFTTGNSSIPSDNVLCLAAGEDGLLWIGTDNGLATFDGVSWTVYNKDNSELPVNAVMSLHHDQRNHITWVGTAAGLVQIENGHWFVDDTFVGDLILSMTSGEEGELWMGTFNHFNFRGRLQRYQDGVRRVWQLADLGYESTFVYDLDLDNQNRPVATLTGTAVSAVVRLEGDRWNELPRHAEAGAVRMLALENSRVWVGGTQLDLYGSETGCVKIPAGSPVVLSMAVDAQGYKWIGTAGDGLFRYHEK